MNQYQLAEVLLDASPDGLLLVDAAGVIRVANPSAAMIFGRPVDELVGSAVETLVPSDHRTTHVAHRHRYVRRPESRSMGSGLRLFAEHADGRLFPVEISLSPLSSDGEQYTIATVRDVTDREEALSDVALLKDRERIARDLHDMVIQRLFAAGMSLQAVVVAGGAPDRRRADPRSDRRARRHDQRVAQHDLPSRAAGGTQHLDPAHRSGSRAVAGPRLPAGARITGSLDDLPDHVASSCSPPSREGLSNVARHAEATDGDGRDRTGGPTSCDWRSPTTASASAGARSAGAGCRT